MTENGLLHQLVSPGGVTDKHLQEARKSFWKYCQYINPKFFKADRAYLRSLCETMQGVFEGNIINHATKEPYRKLMVNIPPRHGKSYVATLFCQWCMGRVAETRIITVSYNETLAGRFARNVRDGIDAEKVDSKFPIFADVFPTTNVKHGDASAQLWSLEGQYFSYLAAGFSSSITGFGASMGIIDDPIKNSMEAFNDRVLEEQWAWYGDTFLSRVEEDGIQIVIMTRWSTKDLCGRLLGSEDGNEWLVFSRAACVNEAAQQMLCPELLSWKSYQKRRRVTSPEIIDANYQQKPLDIQGRLYASFMTYDKPPCGADGRPMFERIIAYVDTADTGADYLCCIIAGEYRGELWVLDVYYTNEPMEKTEPETARRLHDHEVEWCVIESNNGGRGFARNVERILYDEHRNRKAYIEWRHQSANKVARILTASTYVMRHIYYPEDWARRWPSYYNAMNAYQRAGRNAHDDAPDGTTGLVELVEEGSQNELVIL